MRRAHRMLAGVGQTIVLLTACLPALQPGLADDSFYVRGDGSGNNSSAGTNWATAWATIDKALESIQYGVQSTVYVQASTDSQIYDVASRSRSPRDANIYANFEGGWENIDADPLQTGTSVVEDIDGTIDEPGFAVLNGDHGSKTTVSFNRFSFRNVTHGIDVTVGTGTDSADIIVIARDTDIACRNSGIHISYPKDYYTQSGAGGWARFHLTNVTIQAGLAGAGSGPGVYSWGIYNGSSIGATSGQVSTITSSGGDGINLFGHSSDSTYTLAVSDTVIHDCSGNGIYAINWYHPYAQTNIVYTAIRLTLDNCTLANNASNGIRLVTTAGGSWLNSTDSIMAGNGGLGAQLGDAGYANFSFLGGYSCYYNNDIYTNGAAAAWHSTDVVTDPLLFARRDKPYPYYRLAHSGSPCSLSDSTGRNRGAYQDLAPGRGTLVVFR